MHRDFSHTFRAREVLYSVLPDTRPWLTAYGVPRMLSAPVADINDDASVSFDVMLARTYAMVLEPKN